VLAPLVQASPFFAILMSRIFLQAEERITFRLFLSALGIVAGAALIMWGRA
jgi:drug/metabolite transporter (DMT)-like permease